MEVKSYCTKYIYTTYYVQSAECDVREHVKTPLVHFGLEFLYHDVALLVEDVHEVREDFEMESRSEQTTAGFPFLPPAETQIFIFCYILDTVKNFAVLAKLKIARSHVVSVLCTL